MKLFFRRMLDWEASGCRQGGGEEYSMQVWADIGDTRVVIDWSELSTVNTIRGVKGMSVPIPYLK